MKNKFGTVFLQIFCLFTSFFACAQAGNNVVKWHAFSRETIAGNVEVDVNGNPVDRGVDVVHSLYAETTGKILPQWKKVYTRNGVFAIQAEEIHAQRYEVGKQKSDDTPVVIAIKRGNRLWKLELLPLNDAIPPAINSMLQENDMVVITELKGNSFTHKIEKETQLETIFYK